MGRELREGKVERACKRKRKLSQDRERRKEGDVEVESREEVSCISGSEDTITKE